MFGRPTFGTQPTSFGFGTSVPNTTAFGQSNQLFGNNQGGFGTPTTGFGAATQPMFGSTQQTSAPLFGSTNTSTFGQPNQSGFGSTLFGNAAQPSSSGIFGTTSTSTFGQQNKPTGFGFGSSTTSGGLFSQNSQQTPQNAPSVFQNSSTGGMFGTTNTFGQNTTQMGTVVKFVPVTGTDSIQKSGIVQSINTKHYCITCMKDYESKSLEELRLEDYQCNRKGPQQQAGFGGAQPFGITSTSSSIFGQPDNKATFGTPRTDFGTQNAFGMSTQTTTPNAFAKPTTGFGTTSTNSFGFGTNTSSTGLFGSNNTAKPFAAPTAQLFQPPQQQQPGFGQSVFGQTNPQPNNGMFGKPATNGAFNTPQTGFSFPQQNQNSLFQTSKPNTGFGVFGQTTTQTNTFGQQQAQPAFGNFGNNFKPAQPTFGTNTQPTFGNQQNNLFGNTQNKPLFGNAPGGNLFNNNSFQQNTSFQFPTQQQQQQQPVMLQSMDSISQDLRSLVQITDPYGYNKHLEGLSPIKPSNAAYVTNPKDLQKLLESPPPMAVVSPMNKRLKVLPISAKKTNLFDEMLDKETSEINFSLRTTAKRLVLQKELRIRSEDDVENEEVTSHLEIVESMDKQPKIQSSPSVARLSLSSSSSFQEAYSSGSPIGQKDSLTSLITINSNLSKGDASIAREAMGSQFFGDLSHQEPTPRDRGDEPPEASKIDTCGVTLTRPEYFTIPPLEKLIEHKNGDGKCLVKGFTIGRVGYGNVCFPDPMDVANLNLDELVHFRYREVTVYPDDAKKPPVGQGLNRKAQVTLDRVFPKAKIDRKLITDAETLMAINFSDTLRDLCEKHSTKFLDYRPETGSWVFMVEHFSKYGFSDSDDEESTAQVVQKQKLLEQKVKDDRERRAMEEHKRKKQQKSMMGRKFLTEDLFSEDGLQKGDFLTRNGSLSKRIPLMPEDLLLDDEMAIEENSLCTLGASIETLDFDFDSIPPTHAMHHIQARRNLYQKGSDMLLLMKDHMYNGQKFPPIQIKNTKLLPIPPKAIKDLPNRAPPPPPKKHAYYQVKVKPKKFKVQNATYTINIDKSLYKNRNYMDIATFKGRSFKVGWGRGMFLTTKISPKLATPVQLMEASSQSTISAIGVLDASPFMDFEPFKDRLEKHLQVVLDTADVVMQENVPFLKPRPGKTALLRHQLMARETARDNLGNEQVNYYQQIWNLCAACWGPMSKPTNRRDLLVTWLEKAVEQTVEEELVQIKENDAAEVYNKIFTYLTGHYITKAANLAADEDLHNLSLLISQLNASQTAKGIMQQQLEQWRTSFVYDHVHPIVQKLYMLIAGQNIGAGSNDIDPIINVCKDMDWLRCFAIMLWYIAPSTDTIARGVDLYREAFETDGYSARPNPRYANRRDVYDLQYHLMLLHIGRGKPLETALHPETHAKRPTDFRLSWLLLQTLQALDVGTISSAAKTVLTTSFSQQLENHGLYKWAVFVLLYLEDPFLRKEYIMGVLHRNLPGGEEHRMIEDELVTQFYLPAAWLHEVKAYKTTFLGMPWESYKHFTFMEDWVISHKIAITDVVPQLLVNEQFELVSTILRDIEPGCRSIITWPEEGGLVLMFLDMYDKFQENRRFSREEAMSIHSLLLRICTGVTNYPFRTAMQRAAIAEISKHCSIYSRPLLDQMQAAHRGITSTTTAQVDELTMPPDYRIDDMYTEMNDFYEEYVEL